MPRNLTLRWLADQVQDVAAFCTEIKPALLSIAEFLVFFVGLVTLVSLLIKHH